MKKNELRTVIRTIVREEVAMAIHEVITELKQPSKPKKKIVESKPKKKIVESKPIKKKYTSNKVLNDILNETANANELDEYPSMSGKPFDTSRMTEAMGYGNMLGGNEEAKREIGAVQTAQTAGVNPESVPEEVMGALTKDYRGVMNALKKRDGKL